MTQWLALWALDEEVSGSIPVTSIVEINFSNGSDLTRMGTSELILLGRGTTDAIFAL